MTLNGVIAALVAVAATCGFVAPWAAVLIGLIAGVIAVTGVLAVERLGIGQTGAVRSRCAARRASGELSPRGCSVPRAAHVTL